jgi:hypothetical protein
MPNKDCLFDYDGLDGALVCSLLDGILELRRRLLGDNFSDFVSHPKNFRTGFDAQAAGCTTIINSYLHIFSLRQILKQPG